MGRATTTDAELIEASRGGDAAAFGEIVERYQRAVHAVSFSGTGNRALSDDIAQDTFVTAWKQLGALREIDRLPAWLCGIARNLARAALRRRGRETPLDEESEQVAARTPFDALSEHETDQLVATALTQLPEKYREPMVLFYCEGESVKSVAQALGISEDATHQRLSRGRQYLADGMSDLVGRSLGRQRPRRDLGAAVMAAIAVIGGASSQVDASTTSTKGSTSMFTKIGIAIVLAGAATGTALLVQRSGAEPAVVQEATESRAATSVIREGAAVASTSTRTTTTASTKPAQRGTPAMSAAALECNTIARHIADLGMQAQPDVAQLTPEQLALDIQKITEQVEAACTTQNWSVDYRSCIAGATETYTIGVECVRFAPAGTRRPSTGTPQAPYAGTDFGCASVAAHVVTLMKPDPGTDPKERQEAYERARSTMPDQLEVACEQDSWSETRRRCALASTTMDDVSKCR